MTQSPRAVVIPFGVPEDGRGLGLGLAALVHGFAQVGGESVALAQLLSRKTPTKIEREEGESSEASPVEAFVPPQTWRDILGNGPTPPDVGFVVTGAFEPPSHGPGLIQLLVFDAKDGRTRVRVEAPLDGESAGKTLLAALDEAWTEIGGELGGVKDIGDLSWDALESVLRAERCALHDPLRGGPHDRLAAMVHLGRAIGDAPDARFPATRLAALARDVAGAVPSDPRLADAALRALTGAIVDSPDNADLIEAACAISLRLGNTSAAEEHVHAALALEPERARLYALLSEARRARGDLDGALAAIEDGLLHGATDPLLNTERGLVLEERGHGKEAERAWRMVLDERPLYAPAFTNLASLVMGRSDGVAAAKLVDDVLSIGAVHAAPAEVLRRAIQLSLAVEPEGLARASRVCTLAQRLVDRAPADPWAHLVLARALSQTGERTAAQRRLELVEQVAPASTFAAEAQRGRFALEDPQASLEVDSVLRAAYHASPEDLETIASRARALGAVHHVWSAHFAVGIAERRRERWRAARDAFSEAIRVAPGSTPAHMELVGAHVALGDAPRALEHARKACDLDGETARTLSVLATALLASGSREQASLAIDRALALDATDEANRALAERIRAPRPGGTSLTRIRDVFTRWRKR